MGPIGCPETSVRNYRSTLRNIPEERRSHLHRGGSLKSRMKITLLKPTLVVSAADRREYNHKVMLIKCNDTFD